MAFSGEISPAVRSHMKLVYLMVVVGLVACVCGACTHVFWYPGGWLTWYGILGGFGLIVYAPRRKEGEGMHFLFLLGVSLWEGFSVGPGIRMSLNLYPMSILATVLMVPALIFACFSGAAITGNRREFLFVGGLISSVLSFLFWMRCASNIFGSSEVNFRAGVYVRILIFLGCFIFDTQHIMDRAQHGEMDYVKHALILSSDFLAVLVPVIFIIAKIYLRLKSLSEDREGGATQKDDKLDSDAQIDKDGSDAQRRLEHEMGLQQPLLKGLGFCEVGEEGLRATTLDMTTDP